MDGIIATVRQYGQRLMDEAHPELAAYRAENPEWKHPLDGWALMSTESALLTVVAYLGFVLVGTLFMKARGRPITALDGFKFFYNPFQSWLAAWLCIEAGRQAYFYADAKVIGNEFQPDRADMARVLYWFYVSKVFDFVDTLFIILGCKWRQLSVLHVYHHTTIFAVYWLLTNVAYDGDIYLTIVLNGAVHMTMYMYYWLMSLRLRSTVTDATLFDKSGKVIPDSDSQDARKKVTAAKVYSPWWKKFITYFQLAQFVTMNAQAIFLLFVFKPASATFWQYPWRITAMYLVYIQSLFWLFRNFAAKNYSSKKGGKKSKKQ